VPEHFDSYSEFQRHVGILVDAGLIEDASKLWWDVRPSAKFPTLEMRLPDIPTRVEDTIAIAAFYRVILHMLYRLRRGNQRWRRYAAMLISENRWRAQRYGMTEGLVDFGKGEIVPYADLLDELIAATREDAALLKCSAEVEHALTILDRGTSADWQIDVHRRARSEGRSEADAMQAVVAKLAEETLHGL
jgi:carboxylate-amine ligase